MEKRRGEFERATTMSTADANLPAVQIADLHYSYTEEWTRKHRAVLKGITLSIARGESFGFLGHNGAGKTTTIKLILNLLRRSHGTIKIFGLDARDTRARTHVGYLPEQPYFYDNLTVIETMYFYATLAGIPSGDRERKVLNTLARVGLTHRAKSHMRSLSKGLMQRVALAQAIVAEPKLLLLDEPFSGLDPIGRKEFRDLFSELKRAGTTIFMSSHILSDVEFLCDRASIMVRGELKGIFNLRQPDVSISTPGYELVVKHFAPIREIVTEIHDITIHEDFFTRIGFKERHAAERVLQLAIERRAEVQSYEVTYPSLEDLFVKLVQQSDGR